MGPKNPTFQPSEQQKKHKKHKKMKRKKRKESARRYHLKHMFNTSSTIIGARVSSNTFVTLTSRVPPILTRNNTNYSGRNNKSTIAHHRIQIKNHLWTISMKEIFLHRNPNTRTKYNNTTASLDTMNSKTL
jgi:hypothetical protein